MNSLMLLYVPVPNAECGEELARGAVEARLAGCANLIGDMRSFYEWGGGVQSDPEQILIFKTLPERVEALESWLLEAHPYECPCVLRLPPVRANAAYLDWMRQRVG